MAFMDTNPVTQGHALVVSRAHATDLLDITAEDLAACVHLAQEVAGRAKDRLGADGVNLLNCSGRTPGKPCSTSTYTSSRGSRTNPARTP